MLALSVVEEIDRLLRDGQLSRRKIAKQLGVGRGTVDAIANGRRGLFGKQAEADEPEHDALPPERCPKCGFQVHMPCLICRTREYRESRQLLAALGSRQASGSSRSRRRPARRRPVYQARVA